MQHLRTSGLAREHRDLNHFVRARSGRDAAGCGPRRTIVTDSTARNETMGVGIKEQVLPPLNTASSARSARTVRWREAELFGTYGYFDNFREPFECRFLQAAFRM